MNVKVLILAAAILSLIACSAPQQNPANIAATTEADIAAQIEATRAIENTVTAAISATLAATTRTEDPTPAPRHGRTPASKPTPTPEPAPTRDPSEFPTIEEQSDITNQNAHQTAAEGIELFKQARYEEALQAFNKAMEQNGQPSGVIHNWIGTIYAAMRQTDQALFHANQAVQIFDKPLHRFNRAFILAEQDECLEAVTDIRTGLTLALSEDYDERFLFSAHRTAAYCLVRLELYDEAEQHRLQALDLASFHPNKEEHIQKLQYLKEIIIAIKQGYFYPEDPVLWEHESTQLERANDLWLTGHHEQALNEWEQLQASRATPSSKTEIIIATALSGIGQFDAAIIHANKAVALRRDSYTLTNRSDIYLAAGHCENAVQDAQEAIRLNPYVEPGYHAKAENHLTIGLCHYYYGELQEAQFHLSSAITLMKDHTYLDSYINDMEVVVEEIVQELDSGRNP